MLKGEPRLYSKYSDGILIEASHFLLRKRSLLRYFRGQIIAVDPRTPVYQTSNGCHYDRRTRKVRTSYLKLASLHGEPILGKFLENSPVEPRDFNTSVCRRIASDVMELEMAASPKILLPPYFVIQNSKDPWFDVNLRIFREMQNLSGAQNIYLPLAIGDRILENQKEVRATCKRISKINPPGFAIWPVGFNEFDSTVQKISGLAYLLGHLRETKIMLYAGYFSILLCAITGSSFSNGPCFYEKRDNVISPPLEFRPRCRYYLPLIYQKVDPVAAQVLYRTLSKRGIRPMLCEACGRNIMDGDYEGIAEMPDIDVFEHNFLTRRREIDRLKKSGDAFNLGLEDLRALEKIRECLTHYRSMRYVATWIEVLEKHL